MMKATIDWHLKKFEDLSPLELYKILDLRQQVFVVEQNCAYQDVDGKDLKSYHLMGFAADNFSKIAFALLYLS